MRPARFIRLRPYLGYKFFNSLFAGLSIGSVFILYTPLPPSVYSLGGIALALGLLIVAKLYGRILEIRWFVAILWLVELVLMVLIAGFLLFGYSYLTALLIYAGYQVTFMFGSYLVRAETLFLPKKSLLSLLDVVKQKGYLGGMLLSYLFYQGVEHGLGVVDKQTQVYWLHGLLLLVQGIIMWFLARSFALSPSSPTQTFSE